MSFSRINYSGNEEIFHTEVRDGTGRPIENWKCNKKDYPKVIRHLNKKFDLNLIIIDRKKGDRDLDWAM